MIVSDIEQGSDEWLQLRWGKITGTTFKQLFTSTWLGLLDQVVAERNSDFELTDSVVSDAMQRGNELEPIARNLYEVETFQQVQQSGFCLSSKFPFLGLSPDGWVGYNGAIEIKCPNTATHVQHIRQNKIPSKYAYQVLCYFVVNPDLDWLDFISYDPRFKPLPFWVKRITRDDLKKELDEADLKLSKFAALLEETENKLKPTKQ